MLTQFIQLAFVLLRGMMTQEMQKGAGTGPQKRAAVVEEGRAFAEEKHLAGSGTDVDVPALVQAIGVLIDALVPLLNLLGVFKK